MFPLNPAAPEVLMLVIAELTEVRDSTPVPETLTVRNAVSVIPARVELAVSTAFTVAT
jgi:hypothetical protein